MKIQDPTLHPAYDPLLNAIDAAAYLGRHVETVKIMARKRELASVRNMQGKGSNIHFRLSALNAWIRSHEIKPLRQVSA